MKRIKNFLKCVQGGFYHHFYKSNDRKIFVVGLTRTGTSSITNALELLGYPGRHFPSICFLGNKPIWLSGDVLKKNTVLSDISIIPFFDHYYSNFPNALFIMTTRNKKDWLHSLSKKPNLNDVVIRNNNNARLRKFVYGAEKFEETTFSSAYDEHHNQIKSFFKEVPDRLLLIDIPGGDGWEKICQFLDCEIPKETFPHKNKGYNNPS